MSSILQTYRRFPIAFSRGEGVYLFDVKGKQYLDFLASIAVSQLGHAHPRLVRVLKDQAEKLWGVSNYFEIPEQERLAEQLAALSGFDRVFFCNSGAEANEGLIKLSRLWGKAYRGGAHEVIVMSGSFHGRTMATLSATGQEKVKLGFDPLVPSFKIVPPDDIDALHQAVTKQTVGILLEVVRGEGGVEPLSSDYLRAARELCDRESMLLMVDEIQTGMGRTGTWFGFQNIPDYPDFKPDAISLAKGLAGGLPIGAVVMSQKSADLFQPGSHASTFGGNPIVCRVASELIRTIEDEGLLNHVNDMGAYLQDSLRTLGKKHAVIHDVRGRGLMIGCVLDPSIDAARVVSLALEQGLIMNVVQTHVLRFVPPFIIERDHIDQAIAILDNVLCQIEGDS